MMLLHYDSSLIFPFISCLQDIMPLPQLSIFDLIIMIFHSTCKEHVLNKSLDTESNTSIIFFLTSFFSRILSIDVFKIEFSLRLNAIIISFISEEVEYSVILFCEVIIL